MILFHTVLYLFSCLTLKLAGTLLLGLKTFHFTAEVSCFDDECYALAFGIPTALMVVAICKFEQLHIY